MPESHADPQTARCNSEFCIVAPVSPIGKRPRVSECRFDSAQPHFSVTRDKRAWIRSAMVPQSRNMRHSASAGPPRGAAAKIRPKIASPRAPAGRRKTRRFRCRSSSGSSSCELKKICPDCTRRDLSIGNFGSAYRQNLVVQTNYTRDLESSLETRTPPELIFERTAFYTIVVCFLGVLKKARCDALGRRVKK